MSQIYKLPRDRISAFWCRRKDDANNPTDWNLNIVTPPKKDFLLRYNLGGKGGQVEVNLPTFIFSHGITYGTWNPGNRYYFYVRAVNTDNPSFPSAPFCLGNVDGVYGRICWGEGNPVPADLRSAISQFWSAPFNDHWLPAKWCVGRDVEAAPKSGATVTLADLCVQLGVNFGESCYAVNRIRSSLAKAIEVQAELLSILNTIETSASTLKKEDLFDLALRLSSFDLLFHLRIYELKRSLESKGIKFAPEAQDFLDLAGSLKPLGRVDNLIKSLADSLKLKETVANLHQIEKLNPSVCACMVCRLIVSRIELLYGKDYMPFLKKSRELDKWCSDVVYVSSVVFNTVATVVDKIDRYSETGRWEEDGTSEIVGNPEKFYKHYWPWTERFQNLDKILDLTTLCTVPSEADSFVRIELLICNNYWRECTGTTIDPKIREKFAKFVKESSEAGPTRGSGFSYLYLRYLESATDLPPASSLFEILGFKEANVLVSKDRLYIVPVLTTEDRKRKDDNAKAIASTVVS